MSLAQLPTDPSAAPPVWELVLQKLAPLADTPPLSPSSSTSSLDDKHPASIHDLFPTPPVSTPLGSSIASSSPPSSADYPFAIRSATISRPGDNSIAPANYLDLSKLSLSTSFARAPGQRVAVPPRFQEQPNADNISTLSRLSLGMPRYRSASDLYTPSALDSQAAARGQEFRQGDWICASPLCSAHNFSKKTSCLVCGTLRPVIGSAIASPTSESNGTRMRPVLAPLVVPPPSTMPRRASNSPSSASPNSAPQQTVLTPDGKSLAGAWRSTNVSHNKGIQVLLAWPIDFPLPAFGQVRPHSESSSHPPIMNTGNSGPIQTQAGDWFCCVCGYTNWRRRRVCQACYPYADGNLDGAGSAVHVERVNKVKLLLGIINNPDSPRSNQEHAFRLLSEMVSSPIPRSAPRSSAQQSPISSSHPPFSAPLYSSPALWAHHQKDALVMTATHSQFTNQQQPWSPVSSSYTSSISSSDDEFVHTRRMHSVSAIGSERQAARKPSIGQLPSPSSSSCSSLSLGSSIWAADQSIGWPKSYGC